MWACYKRYLAGGICFLQIFILKFLKCSFFYSFCKKIPCIFFMNYTNPLSKMSKLAPNFNLQHYEHKSPRQLTYVTWNFYKSSTVIDFKLFFHQRGTIPYDLYDSSATILKLRIKSETTFHPLKKSTHFLESGPLVAWWWPNYLFFMLGHMMTTLTRHPLITCTCKIDVGS